MSPRPAACRIERAAPRDVPVILKLIRELAEYEKMLDTFTSTEQDIHDALFGPQPMSMTLLAYVDEQPDSGQQAVGFALYFEIFSTFRGRRGVYLEDLYVQPEHRRTGIGKRLLAAVAKEARDRDAWLQWQVLGWNQPAIEFYQRLGATPMAEWDTYRLQGEALARVAESA